MEWLFGTYLCLGVLTFVIMFIALVWTSRGQHIRGAAASAFMMGLFWPWTWVEGVKAIRDELR